MQSLSDLSNFCAHVVRKYGSPRAATEEQKAEEFRNVYLHDLPPDLTTLRSVASACGIELNGMDEERMPRNLRGYHDVYGSRRNIYYRNGDALSGIENTVLHEIREMMETLFVEVNPGYEPLRTSARHTVANRFATAVLLPSPEFRKRAYETGLDVVELARLYSKSCSQVLLRMGEVLQGQLFFYGALYEPAPDGGSGWRVSYWTGCGNEEDPEANMRAPHGFFARKGHPLLPGSLAEMALTSNRAHLAQRIVFNEGMDDSLIALSSPFVVSGAVTKVSLVALLAQDERLLEPQLARGRPIVIDEPRYCL